MSISSYHCSSHRFLLYVRTKRWFLEVIWNLPGSRSPLMAVDGPCKLEKTSGRDRNSGRLKEVLET